MAERNFEYDVALSFAGEQRAYVLQVAQGLRTHGVRVFYDDYETGQFVGEGPLCTPNRGIPTQVQVLRRFCVQGVRGQSLAHRRIPKRASPRYHGKGGVYPAGSV